MGSSQTAIEVELGLVRARRCRDDPGSRVRCTAAALRRCSARRIRLRSTRGRSPRAGRIERRARGRELGPDRIEVGAPASQGLAVVRADVGRRGARVRPLRFAAAVSAPIEGRQPPGKIAALMKSVWRFSRSKLSSGTTIACIASAPVVRQAGGAGTRRTRRTRASRRLRSSRSRPPCRRCLAGRGSRGRAR